MKIESTFRKIEENLVKYKIQLISEMSKEPRTYRYTYSWGRMKFALYVELPYLNKSKAVQVPE